MNEALLIIESASFSCFSVLLFRKERIYGFYFFFIFIYAIFSQIGYLYVPELSMYIHAYFGEEIWRKATWFILLSGTTLFLFLYYYSDKFIVFLKSTRLCLQVDDTKAVIYKQIVSGIFWSLLAVQYCIFFIKHDALSWSTVQIEDNFQDNIAVAIFMYLIKSSVTSNIVLYCAIRQSASLKTGRSLWLLGIFSIVSFMIFTFKVGSRTDIVALFMGVALFETSQIKLRVRHFIVMGILGVGLFGYLHVVEMQRQENAGIDADAMTKLLAKDYYAPAHMLFAVISYDYVRPVEVLASNAANTLVMLNYPYLQMTITDLFLPGIATRSQGYGFYIFAEGYMAAGFIGFLYNGIVLGAGIALWRSVAMTNSKGLNLFILAIMGCMLVNLVRGQSSYFIKYLYTFIVPGVLYYLALTKQRVSLRIMRR